MHAEREDWLRFIKEGEVDGKAFFVFLNDKGEHRLIEAEAYRHFPLVEGQRLKARVRKKGCAGEEITELAHPFFKVGETYPMTVARFGELDFEGRRLPFVAVVDGYGTEHLIGRSENRPLISGSRVSCRLAGQSRGRLSFHLISNE